MYTYVRQTKKPDGPVRRQMGSALHVLPLPGHAVITGWPFGDASGLVSKESCWEDGPGSLAGWNS